MPITPDNALRLIDDLLALQEPAFRKPFQKTIKYFQTDLMRALKAYQDAQQIMLPNGQAALQTRWYRLNTLARKMNVFISLLTAEAVDDLKNQLPIIAIDLNISTPNNIVRLEKHMEELN